MDPQDRIHYVQILAQMLIADGQLADAEHAYLNRIMDALQMPEADRRKALASVSIDSPVEERVRALSESAKATLLAEVERAMHADGELSPAEAHFLERVRTHPRRLTLPR